MIRSFLISILFTASAFANEIVLQPGSSVVVRPNQSMKVTCEGSATEGPATICQCDSFDRLYLVYVDKAGKVTNMLLLQDYDYKSDCFEAMKVNSYCK